MRSEGTIGAVVGGVIAIAAVAIAVSLIDRDQGAPSDRVDVAVQPPSLCPPDGQKPQELAIIQVGKKGTSPNEEAVVQPPSRCNVTKEGWVTFIADTTVTDLTVRFVDRKPNEACKDAPLGDAPGNDPEFTLSKGATGLLPYSYQLTATDKVEFLYCVIVNGSVHPPYPSIIIKR